MMQAESNHYNKQRVVKVASCTLNQWAMDFEGNKNRIITSLRECVQKEANVRLGPELEIPGYGCEDHFLEEDTISHSWEVLADIIFHKEDFTANMLCDFGMPVTFKGIFFNCRVLVYKKQILLIRPKIALADDGNYRETRYFTAWTKGFQIYDFLIPDFISKRNGQTNCKFGVGIIKFDDMTYAPEICEELWIPYSPSIDFAMAGCEIIGNSSGSHFQIGKQERRYELIMESSKKNGGLFIYSNLVGCDGGRLYFDGGSIIALNGKLIEQGKRFILNEVEVKFAVADLNEVISYRGGIKSRCAQSLKNDTNIHEVIVNDFLLKNNNLSANPFYEIKFREYTFEKEMNYAAFCWMWDYLRRSGACGLFLPLSGGADSATVAVMVSLLCKKIYKEITERKDEFILKELRRIIKNDSYYPKNDKDICNNILVTACLTTSSTPSKSKVNSQAIADEIGSVHYNMDIDKIISAFVDTFNENFSTKCDFSNHKNELNHLQSRVKMVLSYMLAGLVPWAQQRKGSFLLVLSSGNLDEMITGALTKYDTTSGDINPIGGLSKSRIKSFLQYCHKELKYSSLKPILNDILDTIPKSEMNVEYSMTYEELSFMGKLRKEYKCGPYSMFRSLLNIWTDKKSDEVLEKVKLFFKKYSINRHKATIITPSLHCESYSIDDNRFDLRQFLYNTEWNFQFGQMERFNSNNKVTL